MSAAVAQYQEKLVKFLHQKGTVDDLMTIAEEKTGVQRIYIAYGIISVIVLWLAIGFGAQLLANLIGFLYPAYCSIKALESGTKKDDTQWLTYWIVFAFFSVIEFFTDLLVGWVPFYWLTKCLFLVWCMAPMEANGSAIIYTRVIRPVFLKNQNKIDNIVNKASNKAGDLFDKVYDTAKEVTAEHIKNN